MRFLSLKTKKIELESYWYWIEKDDETLSFQRKIKVLFNLFSLSFFFWVDFGLREDFFYTLDHLATKHNDNRMKRFYFELNLLGLGLDFSYGYKKVGWINHGRDMKKIQKDREERRLRIAEKRKAQQGG